MQFSSKTPRTQSGALEHSKYSMKTFCGSDEIRTWDTRGKAVKPKTLDHLATGALKG
jgi:hypothetical protein